MKSSRTTEATFETVIEAHLLANGYVAVDRASFDRERAIFLKTVTECTIALLKERSPQRRCGNGQNDHTREHEREFAWGQT